MSRKEKNAGILRDAAISFQKGMDLLNELVPKRDYGEPAEERIGPWMDAEDLAYSMAKDAQKYMDGILEHLERSRGLYAGRLDFGEEARRYLAEMKAEFVETDGGKC